MSTESWVSTDLAKKQPRRFHVCLVTPGHLSTNPRLVKEADALLEAGHRVSIIASRFIGWADEADKEFLNRSWQVQTTAFGPAADLLTRSGQSLSQRIGLLLFKLTGLCTERAFHPVLPALQRAALETPADLYIAHNLAALPAACRAAAKHGAKLGFDAEDFHAGQIPDLPENSVQARLTHSIEEKYLPLCDYLTAASPGIATAYAQAYGLEMPTVINNVFPKKDAPEERLASPSGISPSLYWFSQTIGPKRGLETVLRAISISTSRPVLYLRGNVSPVYRRNLEELAASFGLTEHVKFLEPGPPGEMLRLAAPYDIGLATEEAVDQNRDICLTNKIFSYLLAGIPVIASNTTAQAALARDAQGAVFIFSKDNPQELAELMDDMLLSEPRLENARQEAWRLGQSRFNWDLEKVIFIERVEAVMATFSSQRSERGGSRC